jgi:energy-coupling factor transporter ATP-binding protein EcfA2
MPSVKGIVACSPVFWLNKNRYKYWKRLVEEYKKNDRIIDIALLNGEPFPNSNCTDTEYSVEDVPPIEWTLKMEQLEILFDAIEFPTYHPESTIQYVTNKDSDINLKSPTLLTGDNGVGKSIFAKILSGIIKPTAGNFSIHSPSGEGTARLLFQDSIDQLFGKSIDGHFDWVFLFDRYKGMLAKKIYDEIDFSMRIYLKDFESMGLPALGSQSKRNTLLQTKISLISERLASLPSVLILDEPGWGLSRTIARKLIEIVSQQASRHNIAVLLISQQPDFWNGIIHSHLHFAKDPKSIVKIQKKEI